MSKKNSWQHALAHAITDPAELLQILQLNSALASPEATALFRLRVPREFVARMQKGNPQDPLLLQALPLGAEMHETTGYTADPLQEALCNPVPGLLHKYQGRVLVTFSGVCAINCRYCFRREFPYLANRPQDAAIIDYLQQHPEVREVILSGGDPLVANDQALQRFGAQLLTLPTIKTLRFHTRLPIVLPSRITDDFCAWLQNYPLRKVMVIHCNHPQEIDDSVMVVLQKLRRANVTLLNQSVLLKGINNQLDTLIALSEKLFSVGVLPYYLNLLDKVRGTAQFAVNLDQAKQLQQGLRENLPGYLVPRLVQEIPAARHKMPL